MKKSIRRTLAALLAAASLASITAVSGTMTAFASDYYAVPIPVTEVAQRQRDFHDDLVELDRIDCGQSGDVLLAARNVYTGEVVYMTANLHEHGIRYFKDIPFTSFRIATEEEIEACYGWYCRYKSKDFHDNLVELDRIDCGQCGTMLLAARNIYTNETVFMIVNGHDIGISRVKDIQFSAFRLATDEEIERYYYWYVRYK